jgi:hypothetical protein
MIKCLVDMALCVSLGMIALIHLYALMEYAPRMALELYVRGNKLGLFLKLKSLAELLSAERSADISRLIHWPSGTVIFPKSQ